MKRLTNRNLNFQQRMEKIRRQRIVARNRPPVRVAPRRLIRSNAALSLIIANNAQLYGEVQAMLQDATDVFDFTDQLREHIEVLVDDESQSLGAVAKELLYSALGAINWDQLGQELYNNA